MNEKETDEFVEMLTFIAEEEAKTLEIVERSSGYWIVDADGVAWDEPFVHLSQAIRQLSRMVKE